MRKYPSRPWRKSLRLLDLQVERKYLVETQIFHNPLMFQNYCKVLSLIVVKFKLRSYSSLVQVTSPLRVTRYCAL